LSCHLISKDRTLEEGRSLVVVVELYETIVEEGDDADNVDGAGSDAGDNACDACDADDRRSSRSESLGMAEKGVMLPDEGVDDDGGSLGLSGTTRIRIISKSTLSK
jgi:hypothetical protein